MNAAEMLANTSLFDDLSAEDVAALAANLKPQTFTSGQSICEKGQPGDSMYLVTTGAVTIYLPGEGGKKVILKEVHVGQYFGELSLFDDKPRSASAEATTDVDLLELERDTLTSQIQRRPRIAIALLGELSARIRETNELLSARAAKDVNKEIDENSTLGDRVSDRVAEVAGSWAFILSFLGVLATWMVVNGVAFSKWLLGHEPFDPFPFIFFNLLLSIVAAFQGPVIMMSQNRQGIKDRAQAETDFKVNLKNEIGVENIQRGLHEIKAHLQVLERAASLRAREVAQASLRPPPGA
jgi:CRP/FNR family cyclic AMP-dependent transcriptional regulator